MWEVTRVDDAGMVDARCLASPFSDVGQEAPVTLSAGYEEYAPFWHLDEGEEIPL